MQVLLRLELNSQQHRILWLIEGQAFQRAMAQVPRRWFQMHPEGVNFEVFNDKLFIHQ